MKRPFPLFSLLFLICTSLMMARTPDFDPLRYQSLCERFTLNDGHRNRLLEIMTMTASQRLLDQENFKPNAPALYQAAKARLERENQLIAEMLDEAQREEFNRFSDNPESEELYMWQEGLLLDGDQISRIRLIIDEARPISIGSHQKNHSDQGTGQGQGNMDRPSRGEHGGPGRGQNQGMNPYDHWEALQKKKAKAIKKVLNHEQKTQFEPLFTLFLREGKLRFEQKRAQFEQQSPPRR